MTPLIREMVSINPEASTDYMWFDATEVANNPAVHPTDETLSLPMPFPLCAVALGLDDGEKVLLLVQDRLGARGITGWTFRGKEARQIPSFVYDIDEPLDADGTLQVKKIEGEDRQLTHKVVQSTVNILCGYLLAIHSPTPLPGYTPVDKQKFSNKKRIAKGKAPIYEWHTVVIEPPKPKVEPKGGTHASPRLHDRRGHWRTCKDGVRKVWVRACKVGNAAKGTVFKDYKWKSHDAARQARQNVCADAGRAYDVSSAATCCAATRGS